MKIFVFLFGIFIMFAVLWGGMYIGVEVLPDDSWMKFPVFITSSVMLVIGLLVAIYATTEM